jgi:hypothetical protein
MDFSLDASDDRHTLKSDYAAVRDASGILTILVVGMLLFLDDSDRRDPSGDPGLLVYG